MGLFDFISSKTFGQLIDVIEWIDATRNTIIWKFPRGDNEIKYGAQLIVRESQYAVFLNEGQLGDVFSPGRHELVTKNIPILTTLESWKYGFNSPFKADVYFINSRQFTDQKWGTANPIMLRDPEFGPIRLRAFGSYAFSITNPGQFLIAMAGTNPLLVSEDISGHLRNYLTSRFADALGEAKVPALDLAANYNEISGMLREILQKDFDEYGITLNSFLIENISLPPAVEQALDKRTQMGVLGDMNKYTQFQAANALADAAQNPGAAGNMVGMLAGVNLGGVLNNSMQQASQQQVVQQAPVAGPPPLPNAAVWFVGINGKQEGPFDLAALGQKIAAGEVGRESLVWKQGLANWTKAGEAAELAGLFAHVPPPMPPA